MTLSVIFKIGSFFTKQKQFYFTRILWFSVYGSREIFKRLAHYPRVAAQKTRDEGIFHKVYFLHSQLIFICSSV